MKEPERKRKGRSVVIKLQTKKNKHSKARKVL